MKYLLALSIALASLTSCASNESDVAEDTNPNSETVALCYEHSCNGASTGEKCFSSKDSYCHSLCSENNCSAEPACKAECGPEYIPDNSPDTPEDSPNTPEDTTPDNPENTPPDEGANSCKYANDGECDEP